MDEAKREVLDLLQDRLKRSLARKWNEHDASSELTANEAREKVTELFRDQLTDGIGAKDPGGNAFAGLLSLQTAFPSLPRPPSDDEILHAIERSKADYYAFQALRILACASSDNLGHLSGFPFGGSGSSLIEFMRVRFDGASAG